MITDLFFPWAPSNHPTIQGGVGESPVDSFTRENQHMVNQVVIKVAQVVGQAQDSSLRVGTVSAYGMIVRLGLGFGL